MMPSPKIILFTGAPLPSSITTQSCTLHRFAHPFNTFLDLDYEDYHEDSEISSSQQHLQQQQEEEEGQHAHTHAHAVWRSLLLTRQPLHTGFSQNHNLWSNSFHGNLEFFTTADVTTHIGSQSFRGGNDQGGGGGDDDEYEIEGGGEVENENAENLLTQFCQESLAAHTSTPLSQLETRLEGIEQSQPEAISFVTDSATEFDTTTFDTTTFNTTTDTTTTVISHPPPPHLSDLEDIPPASRITALSPQTISLNLIAAVLSIAHPRTVTTRWGTRFSLVELLIGDETRSGFAVTFWVPSDGGGNDEMASHPVAGLRRQDVVLMENVALHVFRGKVYGQSLRRGLTKLSLLWRRDGGGHYSARDLTKRAASKHPQQEKARLVKDWVIRFVGRDPGSMRKRVHRKSWDKPPDDTQD